MKYARNSKYSLRFYMCRDSISIILFLLNIFFSSYAFLCSVICQSIRKMTNCFFFQQNYSLLACSRTVCFQLNVHSFSLLFGHLLRNSQRFAERNDIVNRKWAFIKWFACLQLPAVQLAVSHTLCHCVGICLFVFIKIMIRYDDNYMLYVYKCDRIVVVLQVFDQIKIASKISHKTKLDNCEPLNPVLVFF